MSTATVLEPLGYDRSPNYFDLHGQEDLHWSRFSHVYRRAKENCGLQGIYIINDKQRKVDVPVVFYCQADDEAQARLIHRRVWNQDVAPFVLVETPSTIRLYCGFRYALQAPDDRARGIIEASVAFNEVADRLKALSAEAIDSGKVWDVFEEEITLHTRVDQKLLKNLKILEQELRCQELNRELSHALIGKFVYLRYLRDRDILSDRKLEKWDIDPEDIFGRNADLNAFQHLNRFLDEWLNGAVFPMRSEAIELRHLRLVSSVFSGDSPQGQQHLDFQPYDFSFIPIETLSIIYEQFLHSPQHGESDRGREIGAYYTPLPLVNYILSELENRKPLREGMRVLDPSCGSGAFLVQCYRALIEKRRAGQELSPEYLRKLLVEHIFGVDRDADACQVAELSLILTLLDYVEPPDLENDPGFKLPMLRNHNIFQADFFDPASKWANKSRHLSFDWLVGNPPWREYSDDNEDDRYVREWVNGHSETCPIGGYQVAEAFVWRALHLLKKDAVAGLVLPAMSLFKMEPKRFRGKLFLTVRVWCVANFSNLAYVLFSGRAERPAMTLFFSLWDDTEDLQQENLRILTFTPFAINQRANRSTRQGKKKDTWNIVVNGSELGEISLAQAARGDVESWKLAMWGSFRDRKLLQRVRNRFPKLTDFLDSCGLTQPCQGVELKDPNESSDPVKHIPELAGKRIIEFSKLTKCDRIYDFPDRAVSSIPPQKAYIRIKGGRAGLEVSEPPHLIVDRSRRFTIYSDQFIAISNKQIGIAGPENTKNILKALSVYLSSDFVYYQQFFTSPEWGVSTSTATLEALKQLPVPVGKLSETEIREWADLRDVLAREGTGGKDVSLNLMNAVNQKVVDILGLSQSEKILIEDFVHCNMKMMKGKAPVILLEHPKLQSIHNYLATLMSELDIFLGNHSGVGHRIDLAHDDISAIMAISLTKDKATGPSMFPLGHKTAIPLRKAREHLMKKHSQWVYFNRNLRIYTDNTLYMLKPLEHLQWTNRQAILDAGEVIAETLGQVQN